MNTFLLILYLLLPSAAWAADAAPQPEKTVVPQTGQALVLGQNTQNPAMQAQSPSGQTTNPQAGEKSPAQRDANREGKQEQDAQALFQESLRQMMPLSEEQIQEYRKWSDQRDRALLPVSPTLSSRSVHVELEPGCAPVVVRTTANIATSIVFHDSTGQPWPITSRECLKEVKRLSMLPLQEEK